MTARPTAGTRNSRHLRQPAGGDFRLGFTEETLDDHGVRIRIAFPCARAADQSATRDCGHADVTVPDARHFLAAFNNGRKMWSMVNIELTYS